MQYLLVENVQKGLIQSFLFLDLFIADMYRVVFPHHQCCLYFLISCPLTKPLWAL